MSTSTAVATKENSKMKKRNIIIGILSVLIVASWGYFAWNNNKGIQVSAQQQAQIEGVTDSRGNLQKAFDKALMMLDSLQDVNDKLEARNDFLFNTWTTRKSDLLMNNSFRDYKVPDNPEEIEEWRTCTINEPRKLGTLNSGSDKFFYSLTKGNSYSAGLFGIASGSIAKNVKIAIIDYIEYKDTICTPGDGTKDHTSIRLAAGVRLQLTITNLDKKFKAETTSKIAAAMELNLATVQYKIKTIGFKTGDTRKLLGGIESEGAFDVKSYVKIIDAVNKVISLMDNDLIVNPERVPISE